MSIRIKTIYLDMDGVLCDFDARWKELFGESPAETRTNRNFSPNWDKFVQEGNFATLAPFPGWTDLYEKAKSFEVNLEILSSSGGQKYHLEVSAQKKQWLKTHRLHISTNFVPGRRLKSNYANANSLLIDDTEDVILGFHDAGGYGILHDSAERTIKMMDAFFNDDRIF